MNKAPYMRPQPSKLELGAFALVIVLAILLVASLISAGCTIAPKFAEPKQIACKRASRTPVCWGTPPPTASPATSWATIAARATRRISRRWAGNFPGLKDADDGWSKVAAGNWCRPDVMAAMVAMEIWAANPELAPGK